MSFKIAEAHIRCKICSKYRAQRYCPRKGKDICWHCCIELKIDKKCPKECAYIFKDVEENVLKEEINQSTKVDSRAEYQALVRKVIDIWANSPSPQFNGQVPMDMVRSPETREILRTYLNNVVKHPLMPGEYISKKFALVLETGARTIVDPERVVEEYLGLLMNHKPEESIKLLRHSEHYKDQLYRDNYLKRRKENLILPKILSYDTLFVAGSEDNLSAMVYLELNRKYDLTIMLFSDQGNWKVEELIIGNPSFIYSRNDVIKLISTYLAQGEIDKAKEYLDKYLEILIDCSDIHYLKGLSHQIKQEYEEAIPFYLNAVELDPAFAEYKKNLALCYQMMRDFDKSQRFYQETLTIQPDNLNALNNLSIIYEAKGNLDKTVELLEKCLEIDPEFESAKKNLDRIRSGNKGKRG